jgi:hypothetical protein
VCGRRRLAHAGMPGLIRGVAQEESRTEKTAKKTPVALLALFAGDGLKMSNNAAERAIRAIALGRKIFLLVPTPEDGVRQSFPPSSRMSKA